MNSVTFRIKKIYKCAKFELHHTRLFCLFKMSRSRVVPSDKLASRCDDSVHIPQAEEQPEGDRCRLHQVLWTEPVSLEAIRFSREPRACTHAPDLSGENRWSAQLVVTYWCAFLTSLLAPLVTRAEGSLAQNGPTRGGASQEQQGSCRSCGNTMTSIKYFCQGKINIYI